MKTLPSLLLLCMLINTTSNINAQVVTSSRPYLFNNFSENIPASVTELNKAFNAEEGSSIQLNFTNKFSFTGTVFSSVHRYANLSSVIIKSPALSNAILSISKRINDDNTITYVARIINEKFADGYELTKDTAGNYFFNKIKTDELIQDF